jgi:hypothetical protein
MPPARILPAVPKITVKKYANFNPSKYDVRFANQGSIIDLKHFIAARLEHCHEADFHFGAIGSNPAHEAGALSPIQWIWLPLLAKIPSLKISLPPDV